jgi:PHP family Zn ribbon phosphoesterase
MRYIADLHIHSRHSRACSRDLTPENLWRWAQLKGIRVVGTGDCTHPLWLGELRDKLEPGESGLFSLKQAYRTHPVPDSCRADVSFLLSGEISCIYRKGERTRKVHALVFLPDFAAADRLNRALARIGSLAADGRPILGLDVKLLLQMVLDASPEAMLVPAHAWTPHFSVFGAASGFDSLEECFEELTTHIHAIETGLSSDPAMNWRLSQLDGISLISNSDAHSPARLGREATMLAADAAYPAIMAAIKGNGGLGGFSGPSNFFPRRGNTTMTATGDAASG